MDKDNQKREDSLPNIDDLTYEQTTTISGVKFLVMVKDSDNDYDIITKNQ